MTAPTINTIIAEVANLHGLTVADLTGTQRCRHLAHPRQTAMFLAHAMTARSFPLIGKAFGNRHHTTVMHGVYAVCRRLVDDADLERRVELLKARIERAP